MNKETYLATYIEKRFGLSSGYFKRAYRQGTKLDLIVSEKYNTLLVTLPSNVHELISEGYISVRVDSGDCLDLYEHIYPLTKSTLIGFYK